MDHDGEGGWLGGDVARGQRLDLGGRDARAGDRAVAGKSARGRGAARGGDDDGFIRHIREARRGRDSEGSPDRRGGYFSPAVWKWAGGTRGLLLLPWSGALRGAAGPVES